MTTPTQLWKFVSSRGTRGALSGVSGTVWTSNPKYRFWSSTSTLIWVPNSSPPAWGLYWTRPSTGVASAQAASSITPSIEINWVV